MIMLELEMMLGRRRARKIAQGTSADRGISLANANRRKLSTYHFYSSGQIRLTSLKHKDSKLSFTITATFKRTLSSVGQSNRLII